MEEEGRLPEHRRIPELERMLGQLNAIVEAGVLACTRKWELRPAYPTIFVVGCGRSGTTLLMQWLAASNRFAYPTNLASRLYASPLMGALLHRILIELDAREEILPSESRRIDFSSVLGKTRGATQPNEYWYWWRRFFTFGETQPVPEEVLAKVDTDRFQHELAQFEQVFDRPVALKAMLLNWNLPFLARVVPRPLFLNVRREPAANAASLMSARQTFYGNRNTWYSFKPPEYAVLRDAEPDVQVAGQVLATQRAVQSGLAKLPSANILEVQYERFCNAPEEVWKRLSERFVSLGDAALGPYKGPPSFERREHTVPPGWSHALEQAEKLLGQTTS